MFGTLAVEKMYLITEMYNVLCKLMKLNIFIFIYYKFTFEIYHYLRI